MIPIGPLTVDRHRRLRARGVDLRVIVRGEDMTHRCRYADDTPGRQVAVLFRRNARGHCHLDEDGAVAVEIADDNIQIRRSANDVRVGIARCRRSALTPVPYIPADPQDIMAALLKVAPPPAGDKSTRKVKRKAVSKRKVR
jgi:hypothetical protein